MPASFPDESPVAATEPALRFRHLPLLLVALSAAVTQPYARSVGELLLASGITVLALTPPVAQFLRHLRQRTRGLSRPAAPLRDGFSALLLVGLANLIFLIQLLILRGSLFAR